MKVQPQIAQHFIGAIRQGGATAVAGAAAGAGKIVIHQFLRLVILSRQEQTADFRQRGRGLGAIGLLHRAGPQGILVQHHALLPHPAKVHGAEPAVAQGQRFGKDFRGRIQPETRVRGKRPNLQRGGKTHNNGE